MIWAFGKPPSSKAIVPGFLSQTAAAGGKAPGGFQTKAAVGLGYIGGRAPRVRTMSRKLWFTSEAVEDRAVLFMAVPDISAQPHPTRDSYLGPGFNISSLAPF